MRVLFTTLSFFTLLNISVYAQHIFTIDTTKTFQTIQGFGASDAWSNEMVKNWNDSVTNAVADLLFSKEFNPDGSCKGAGLSIWRYNQGTGSYEQGDSSYIGDSFRRTEMIVRPNGTINPNAQTGTQNILTAAKERGVENLVMFFNSPPVHLTSNGKAFTAVEHVSNLSPSSYGSFAEYIIKSLQYFETKNIHFNYVSPVNEPEWEWNKQAGQEGNPYSNQQITSLVKEINQRFATKNITAKIQVPESGLLVFANPGYRFRPHNDNQVNSFFKKGKAGYIGDQEAVAKQICAHSYFTEWPLWINRKVRKRVARTTHKRDVEYWMTEYCILKDNKEIISGHGRDLGMHTALYVARVIHNDLVYGNASAWCWWLGISSADFKDGLVYVNRDGSGVIDSKTMWAMGNFSRFVKPGTKRILVKGKRDNELMVSAYKNPEKNTIVTVIINMKDETQNIILQNLPQGVLTAWETSDESDLKFSGQYPSDQQFTIKANSITSLVLKN